MEPKISESGILRNFGYCQIHWEIENYFPATCKKYWIIYSPEFKVTGYCLTKWRLFLKSAKVDDMGESAVSIHLERCESDSFSGTVRVNWSLWYHCGDQNITICEKECLFVKRSSFPTRIKTLKQLENRLQSFSPDKLCIGGLILVHSIEDNITFKRSTDLGLKSLSQDMRYLYKVKYYDDITVHIECKPFLCHKAILSARSNVLRSAIEMNEGEDEIDLDWHDTKSTELLFGFLYSGNLDYVLRRPSISMDRTIKYFGIKELEKYYLKEELTLKSKFDVIKVSFRWLVTNIISENKTYFVSPHFYETTLNLSFQLHLLLNEDESDYFGIYLDVVEGSKPSELFIEYELIDIFGHSTNKRAMRWSSEEGGKIRIVDFSRREILEDPFIVGHGSLCILCRLFIPTGSSYLSLFSDRTCSLDSINCEEHYVMLSLQLSSLFETGKYSDLTLVCGEERFKVHKYILKARSPFFRNITELLKTEHITIPYLDPHILRIALSYIYSGILNRYEIGEIFKVYDTAEKLVMMNLKNKCSKILQGNLQLQNVIEALNTAYVYKDYKLKALCFTFIMNNTREILKQDNWKKSIAENSLLYKEFMVHLRNRIESNPEQTVGVVDFVTQDFCLKKSQGV